MGPSLGNGGPGRRVSIAGVVFTPARGVIHPSFPLRGRWERSVKSDKQAPSPSLVSLHISSFETRPRGLVLHGPDHCSVSCDIDNLFCIFTLDTLTPHAPAPFPHSKVISELQPNSFGRPLPNPSSLPIEFQNPGNKIIELSGLSVFSWTSSTMTS